MANALLPDPGASGIEPVGGLSCINLTLAQY